MALLLGWMQYCFRPIGSGLNVGGQEWGVTPSSGADESRLFNGCEERTCDLGYGSRSDGMEGALGPEGRD